MMKVMAAVAATTMLAGAALACAPAATAAVNPATLVDSWYDNFLGRDADAGSQYWTDQLNAGARPSDLVWAITHTPEYNVQRLDELYLVTLGRTASSDPGAAYWIRGVNEQRFPLEWVQQNVFASPEYTQRTDREQLVRSWYAGVFAYDITSYGEDNDRQPSNGEISYWSARIAAVGALAAYRELYYAPEVVVHRITDHYRDLLIRDPSPGEIAYWYPKEVESDINVAVLIASTPEYADRVDDVD